MNTHSEASFPVSEDSNSASIKPDGTPCGKSRSTPLTGLSLLTDFLPPGSIPTCVTVGGETSGPSSASPWDSPVRTSPSWDPTASEVDCEGTDPASSPKASVSLPKSNLSGWSLKTFQGCSLSTLGRTLSSSSSPLPNAGIWDSSECSMLNISESPSAAADYSLSRVLENTPPLSSWLTPVSWSRYLLRLARNKSILELIGLSIVSRHRLAGTPTASTLVRRILSLKRTDGIRCLSGPERLRLMGFASDWMRPTLRRLGLREMPSALISRDGSLNF